MRSFAVYIDESWILHTWTVTVAHTFAYVIWVCVSQESDIKTDDGDGKND